jgi:malonyl-CoA O-methyltransferase
MSTLSQLQQHINRWQPHAEKATFLTKEIGTRLIERLDLIKLKPTIILDASNIFHHQTKELLQRYSDATILTATINPNIINPTSLWQRWQRQGKNIIADFHHLPLPDESVDFVFSNCLLYSSWNLPTLIQEWYRVLKPNGLLLFSSLGPDTLKELRASQQSRFNPFIDMHDIGDMLLHRGFSDPVMDMEMLTVYYQNFKQLLHDVRVNSIPVMPVNYRGKLYLQQLEQAYKTLLTDDNKLPVTCEIIYGHAWKIQKPAKNSAGEFAIPINKIKR